VRSLIQAAIAIYFYCPFKQGFLLWYATVLSNCFRGRLYAGLQCLSYPPLYLYGEFMDDCHNSPAAIDNTSVQL